MSELETQPTKKTKREEETVSKPAKIWLLIEITQEENGSTMVRVPSDAESAREVWKACRDCKLMDKELEYPMASVTLARFIENIVDLNDDADASDEDYKPSEAGKDDDDCGLSDPVKTGMLQMHDVITKYRKPGKSSTAAALRWTFDLRVFLKERKLWETVFSSTIDNVTDFDEVPMELYRLVILDGFC